MASLDNVKRIRGEDFKKEEQQLVDTLGSILNQHMDQVVDAFDGQIDFSNLNQEIVTITTIVNANGRVVQSIEAGAAEETNPQFTSNSVTRPIGATIIKASNLTNPAAYTTGCPFIHFSIEKDNLFKINKIEGLVSGNKYSISIILFGS